MLSAQLIEMNNRVLLCDIWPTWAYRKIPPFREMDWIFLKAISETRFQVSIDFILSRFDCTFQFLFVHNLSVLMSWNFFLEILSCYILNLLLDDLCFVWILSVMFKFSRNTEIVAEKSLFKRKLNADSSKILPQKVNEICVVNSVDFFWK